MILLAIDTASALCAACVYDSDADQELGRSVLELGKGHAEHLMAVVDEALAKAGVGFDALDRIVVSVGPGSFTGVRVGVAAARGFALALKIPAVGVTTLESVAAEARKNFAGKRIMVALDGGRGEINLGFFDEAGQQVGEALAMNLEDAAGLAVAHEGVLAGSAAAMVAVTAGREFPAGVVGATADIGIYARLGAAKAVGEKPKPLYLREADAKPQAGFVLPRIRS
ncbi:MAG: tRNA (adenosine(37)-N6)-threonylcarbamoyltransferase complex dimerization subunit type 1 TsaB [Mesorhizobium sp.]|nr:tRNA (adenosine(37)-N6)-threonylcarbamoyltransferase complex dimerization subunit type 1 TsaB [Mesorhizobium sp.]MBL8579829.1 tRNA (adenosine(37)-N6)-threonylcarbamoyltransferase complex dimerization subunit type 1 TsaB [Mesorhizobium sp.]